MPDGEETPQRFDVREAQRLSARGLLPLVENSGMSVPEPPSRAQLLVSLMQAHTKRGSEIIGGGILEVLPDGFGFLRNPWHGFVPDVDDFYVSPAQILRFGLREGDLLAGSLRPPRGSEANFAVLKFRELEKHSVQNRATRIPFNDLDAVPPERPLRFAPADSTLEAFDDRMRLAYGSRAVLTGRPRCGLTSRVLELTKAATQIHGITTCVLLLDVRPDEAQAFRTVGNCHVAAADTTSSAENQVRVARLGLERAKRLVEHGDDVLLLVDSLGAYCRAFRTSEDTKVEVACAATKALLASARAISPNGSLTMIGSLRLDGEDDAIVRELRRTADIEIQIDATESV